MRRHGIRICSLCPQFTDTALVLSMVRANPQQAAEVMADTQGRLLTVDKVGREWQLAVVVVCVA